MEKPFVIIVWFLGILSVLGIIGFALKVQVQRGHDIIAVDI